MSSFAIKGYSYDSSYIYSYLGRTTIDTNKLGRAFEKFNVTPTGSDQDIRNLDNKMYAEYTAQVKGQMKNQDNKNDVPWARLCGQIGVKVTGNFQTDKAAVDNALKLFEQSAFDPNAQAQVSLLKSEAANVFSSHAPESKKQPAITFEHYKAQFLH